MKPNAELALIIAATYEVFPHLNQIRIEYNTAPVSETLARLTPPEKPCNSWTYRYHSPIKGQGETRMMDRLTQKLYKERWAKATRALERLLRRLYAGVLGFGEGVLPI